MSWRNLKIYLPLASAFLFIIIGIFLVSVFYLGGEDLSSLMSFDKQLHKEVVLKMNDGNFLPANKKEDIILLFGGDVMLSRTVNAKMSTYNNYLWPLESIASTTAQADITAFNLESPFLKGANYNVPTGSFSFKANPDSVSSLVSAGADVLSLANNHIMNMGEKGLFDTIDILQTNNIMPIGAGTNLADAHAGTIIKRNHWRIGFLAYAYPDDSSVATETRPGIANMNLEELKKDIEALQPQVDLIVVMMHAGVEYVSKPNAYQLEFAHAAIDDGADLVIGHHSHWLQSWEVYKGKPIFYSLGNLVFDQMWSPATSHGLLLRLNFKEDLSGQAEFIPISISDYGQAHIITDEGKIDNFWQLYDLPRTDTLIWTGKDGN